MTDEALIERLALAAGLATALADHRDEVLYAGRAAAGFQSRRTAVATLALEPAHVCTFEPAPRAETVP